MVRTASRPPWNYDLMSAGYWLALIPTFLILAGIAQAFWRLIRKPNVLDMQNVGLLFLTGLFLYEVAFKASAYSSPKAFYASGMMVVVCLFAASGWAWITRLIPVSRPILAVGLTIWGLAIFCSFWIRPSGTQTRMRIVRGLAAQDLNDSAIQKALAYLRSDPANPELNQLLCHILIEGGQIEPVKKIIAAYFNGNDYRWWFVKARAAALEKNYDEAISCARTSLQLAPDYNYANYQLAAWLQVAGRKEEALVAGKEAVRVMPFSSESHAMLAKIASELGDEQEAAFHNRLVPILR
jgi:tetratricopeptide (TPR) repeat protein